MFKITVAVDEGKCHVDVDEWRVRSIQNRTVSKYFGTKKTVISLVHKLDDITWQKGKWLANFPAHYRQKFTRWFLHHTEYGATPCAGIHLSEY